jgi:DNA-binding transcriptional MerR regulator
LGAVGGDDLDGELLGLADQGELEAEPASAAVNGEVRLRIDDLARLSGTTVDTVRFYQREGLLPPATRRGRSLLYGPAHLERLERIQSLQARHFTLKGIRALAEEGRLAMLDRLFGGEKRTFTRSELIAESGLESEEVEQLEAVGLLGDPALHGAPDYDGEDLAALTALRASMDRGMPASVAVFLVRLYDRHMEALRNELFDIFNIDGSGLGPALSDDDLDAFRTVAANSIDDFLDDSCVVLEYLHRREVRRLVVQAMARADAISDGPLPGRTAEEPGEPE